MASASSACARSPASSILYVAVTGSPPAVLALFRNQPQGFSKTHYNALEPRLGLAYSLNEKTIARASIGVFHNRVTLNDSSLLGGGGRPSLY